MFMFVGWIIDLVEPIGEDDLSHEQHHTVPPPE